MSANDERNRNEKLSDRGQIDRRRFHHAARNVGASLLLAFPFFGRWFDSASASVQTPAEQLTKKFGTDLTLRGQDKFMDDIIGRKRPEAGADDKPVQVAYNRFSRAYNRFSRAYNRFSR